MAPPSTSRLLTLAVNGRNYGVRADRVQVVARMPRLSRVPQAPAALMGLANVRGSVVPVLALHDMLPGSAMAPTRMVVADFGQMIGLAVREVGEIKEAGGELQELDIEALIASITPVRRAAAGGRMMAGAFATEEKETEREEEVSFLTFAIGAQDFAFSLPVIDEVMGLPADIAAMPHSGDVVVGSVALRGAILPLLSLRALLGFPDAPVTARTRVIVVRIGKHRIGLVVDAMRTIVRVPESSIDGVPLALTRGSAEARIQAICRLDDGRRLVSVLAPDQLLRDDLTVKLLQGSTQEQAMMENGEAETLTEQFLLFRIGSEEFGIPISAVDEVANVPARPYTLPHAPAFVLGIFNLRGQVIPLIDQGRRFGGVGTAGRQRRVVIAKIDDLRAGFIVEEVTGVVSFGASQLQPAPDFGDNDAQVFERVVNLPDEDRLVLLISPRELLDRIERDLLRTFTERSASAP